MTPRKSYRLRVYWRGEDSDVSELKPVATRQELREQFLRFRGLPDVSRIDSQAFLYNEWVTLSRVAPRSDENLGARQKLLAR